MNYFILCSMFGFFISACDQATTDLNKIAFQKSECKDFQSAFKKVNPPTLTDAIANRISTCKKYGAWE